MARIFLSVYIFIFFTEMWDIWAGFIFRNDLTLKGMECCNVLHTS